MTVNEKKIIQTMSAPKPVGPYSQAVKVGPFLFCSGQIAIDPKTNEVVKGSVTEQTQLIMRNIQAVLREAGYSFDNVIKTTIFLKNMDDFSNVNEVYGTHFGKNPPARSTIEVARLPKGVDVEIEVTAHI